MKSVKFFNCKNQDLLVIASTPSLQISEAAVKALTVIILVYIFT